MGEVPDDDWDDEPFDYDEADDCDCSEYTDIDIFEGRASCFRCQRSWYLTAEELRTEIKHQADAYLGYLECVEEDAAIRSSSDPAREEK
ncbi:hypothetical protein EVC14_028 [Rhizobium phage RHph_I3_18]|nr:hypothetical protein EVC14_028 [Rhizobium phage RHph_I3_18]